MSVQNALREEGINRAADCNKAQDLHTMLDVILEEYVQIQRTGFIWDLVYNKKIYKDVEFVLFTPFMKLDTDEAEKLCGKYSSRGLNTGQLCRYCECPTDLIDDYNGKHRMKEWRRIKRLVDRNCFEELKAMSQHHIQNACYKL